MNGKKQLRFATLFAYLVFLVSMLWPVEGAIAQMDFRHWLPANRPGFGDPGTMSVSSLEVYNGQLYAGTLSWPNGGSVWRYVEGKTWEVVAPSGLISKPTINPAITDMIVFNNDLYIGTSWGTEPQIWRYNGVEWSNVAAQNGNGLSTFAVFNNELYVGTAYLPGSNTGAEVRKSSSGDMDSWVVSVAGGNGNMNSIAVNSLKVFNGYLYAAVYNEVDGIQVWRTADGAAWETVINNGFGDLQNQDPGGFTVFCDYLYLGVRNETSGGKLFRTQDGVTWEPVVVDGFGDLSNIKIEGTVVFENMLYAVTYNRANGLEIWNSPDGTAWSPAQKSGFYTAWNTNSLWNSALAVYNDTLFIGTSNYNFENGGGEVWRFVLLPEHVYLPITFR